MLKFLSVALIGYVAYCVFLFVVGRHMIFPRHYVATPPESATRANGIEKHWLALPFGKVETWFLPAKNARTGRPSPAVVFAHGNAELIDFCPLEMQPFSEMGIAVLLVEYPGYGRSQGSPSERTITATLCAAYDRLVAREDIDPEKVVLYGRSIGGGGICALARERPSAAMILTSTFTSIRAMAAKYLVPGFLVRDPFDNLRTVSAYSAPILLIHGRYDEVIPFKHGQRLYQAAANAEFIAYECGHNDCPPDINRFWRDVGAFLQRAGIIASAPPESPADKARTEPASQIRHNKSP